MFGDLVRSLSLGGRAIVYGGLSSEQFSMHSFDILMRVATIESYAYRYFFTPPQADHLDELQRMIRASTAQGFPAEVGGWNALDDFGQAVRFSLERPELGKQLFRM